MGRVWGMLVLVVGYGEGGARSWVDVALMIMIEYQVFIALQIEAICCQLFLQKHSLALNATAERFVR